MLGSEAVRAETRNRGIFLGAYMCDTHIWTKLSCFHTAPQISCNLPKQIIHEENIL